MSNAHLITLFEEFLAFESFKIIFLVLRNFLEFFNDFLALLMIFLAYDILFLAAGIFLALWIFFPFAFRIFFGIFCTFCML